MGSSMKPKLLAKMQFTNSPPRKNSAEVGQVFGNSFHLPELSFHLPELRIIILIICCIAMTVGLNLWQTLSRQMLWWRQSTNILAKPSRTLRNLEGTTSL